MIPADGRQSVTALTIARDVRRLLRTRSFSSLAELSLTNGRRADIAAVNRDGEVLIVEVKPSAADFRADRKVARLCRLLLPALFRYLGAPAGRVNAP